METKFRTMVNYERKQRKTVLIGTEVYAVSWAGIVDVFSLCDSTSVSGLKRLWFTTASRECQQNVTRVILLTLVALLMNVTFPECVIAARCRGFFHFCTNSPSLCYWKVFPPACSYRTPAIKEKNVKLSCLLSYGEVLKVYYSLR